MSKPKKSRKKSSKGKRDHGERRRPFAEGCGGPDEPQKPGIGRYPGYLRGLATNRYGGNKLQREEGLKGNTYGPASPARVYTEDERKQYEKEMRERGDLR